MKTLLLALISFIPAVFYGQELNDHETMPFFSMKGYDSEDGDMNLFNYIQDNLDYPEKARENCQTGTIIMTFMIDCAGKVVGDSLCFDHYPLLIEQSKKDLLCNIRTLDSCNERW